MVARSEKPLGLLTGELLLAAQTLPKLVRRGEGVDLPLEAGGVVVLDDAEAVGVGGSETFLLGPHEAEAALALLPAPLRAWLSAEQDRVTRQVDERLIERGDVAEIAPAFLPEAGRVFRLSSRWVAAEAVRVTDSGFSNSALRRRFLGRARVLFLAHPLAAADLPSFLEASSPGPVVYASATASTRTVLAWGAQGSCPPFFAKLSVPGELSGMNRTVLEREAVTAVGLTRLLAALGARRPVGLRILREVFSVVPVGGRAPGGFIVREVPSTVLQARTALVPWFALTHPSRDGAPPLLLALARKSRSGLLKLVHRELFRPFLRAWVETALEQGWMPEAHAQNLLVEFDRNGRLTRRFFVRDLEGAYADLPFIESRYPSLAAVVGSLPKVRHQADDYDQLELAQGARASLHTYFLGGPLWHLERAGRRWVRQGLLSGPAPERGAFRHLFFAELEERMKAAAGQLRTERSNDSESFGEWVFEERHRRIPRPRLPAGIRRWIDLEQAANDRARDDRLFAPIDLSSLPARYDPSRRPRWRLEYLEVPADELELSALRLPRAIRRGLFLKRGGRRYVRLFIHPWMREQYGLDVARHGLVRGPYWATPTASIRSLVVWSEKDPDVCFGLKLSVDVEIQHINRMVKASKLARAIALTQVLDAIPSRTKRRHGFSALREPLVLRTPDRGFGTIVREIPSRTDHLVPGFSLFAARAGGRPPIAIELAGHRAGARGLVAWIEAHLWQPLVRACAYLMFQEGLIGDLHQQNVLFERRVRGELSGQLVLRDLDSFKTDLDLRFRRGRTLRPYTVHSGPCDDLKLDQSHRLYDEAWSKELRGEWVYLATRLARQHASMLGGKEAVRRALAGCRLWASFDRLILEAAAEHLGDELVLDELAVVLRGRRCAAARKALKALGRQRVKGVSAREALCVIPGLLLVDPRAPRMPLYSLNALVNAWKRRAPTNRAPRATRRDQAWLKKRFSALAAQGRATLGGQLPAGSLLTEEEGVLVAWGPLGQPVNYALGR